MFASATASPHPVSVCLAQVIGITAPAIYSSITFAYSYVAMPPLIDHAPEKVLAKQWLQAYQYGPAFVPPFIISGTLSNALLAYFSPSLPLKLLYGSAAAITLGIIPVTVFFFEPNVNGAGKWKAQQILQDEGFYMQERKGLETSVNVHTATPEARKWAETVEMKDIAKKWASLNAGRYLVTAIATVTSAAATCIWGTDLLM